MSDSYYRVPPLFQTSDNTPIHYVSHYGPTNHIWSQQDGPVFDGNLTGNIPDPNLQMVSRGVDAELRNKSEVLRERDHQSAKQVRFNNLISGTSTSYVGSREDAHENYNHMLTTQKVTDSHLVKKVLLGVAVYYVFFK